MKALRVCHLGRLAYLFFENRNRDPKYGPVDKARSDEAGMQDQTELQNKPTTAP